MSEKTQKEGLALQEIFTATAAFILITVLVVLLLQIGFHVMRNNELERKTVLSPEFTNLEAEQKARLDEPLRWVDKDAGTVGLPIEKAMAAVVRNNSGAADSP